MVITEAGKEHQRLDVTQWRIEEGQRKQLISLALIGSPADIDVAERREREWKDAVSSLRTCAECPKPVTPVQFLDLLQESSAGLDDSSQSEDDQASQLTEHPAFKSWSECHHSCMLLLTPHNGPESPPAPHRPLWSSPAISQLVMHVSRKQNHRVFYHPINDRAPRPSSLVALIICDILDREDDLFKCMGQQAKDVLMSDRSDELVSLEAYLRLLYELVRYWGEKHASTTFYIIFDRLHVYFRRRSASSGDKALSESAIAMLKGLYRLSEKSQQPVVKVLVQVDATRREHIEGRLGVFGDPMYLRFSGLLSP